jgi:hypothetical protein
MPLPVDHLVLPVVDLSAARSRLGALGFTVAPDARHPFGTENACVFFRDKTYLEPLAVADQDACDIAARAGNQFVARNNAFRSNVGLEGLSAIAMGSSNADTDDAMFRQAGISGGDMLHFSRLMALPNGAEIVASFKLAFAADPASPGFFLFTCQRIDALAADRSALETHANGVTGISTILLSEPEPDAFKSYLTSVIDPLRVSADDEGLDIIAGNAKIRVLNADGFHALNGEGLDLSARGLRGRAIVFNVDNLVTVTAQLLASDIRYQSIGTSLLVDVAPGQGVPFIFYQEQKDHV